MRSRRPRRLASRLSDQLRDNHNDGGHTTADTHGQQGQFRGQMQVGADALGLPDKGGRQGWDGTTQPLQDGECWLWLT
jgi:hypothetical protein